MPRVLILALIVAALSAICSGADEERPADDGPHRELLYPAVAQPIDYQTRSGDSIVISTRMATPDEFDTVLQFYAEKLGRELDPQGNRIRLGNRDPLVSVVTNDSQGAASSGPFVNFVEDKPRGVRLLTFVKDTPGEHVTLVISRTDDEGFTHIVLTHIKRPSAD